MVSSSVLSQAARSGIRTNASLRPSNTASLRTLSRSLATEAHPSFTSNLATTSSTSTLPSTLSSDSPKTLQTSSSSKPSAVTTESLDARRYPSPAPKPSWKLEGRQRPPRPTGEGYVEVPKDHPLYAFFRRDPASLVEGSTKTRYFPFEAYWEAKFASGRSWTAVELRRKSFQDLHTLWYVLARERNLLSTQRQSVARFGLRDRSRFSYPDLELKCRTTMSRIKQVLNERRVAYLGAAKILAPEVETVAAPTEVDSIPVPSIADSHPITAAAPAS